MFLYIENASTMLFGYVFWYMLSRLTTVDVIGTSASLISVAAIFVSLISVGIPLGSQRFLGKLFLEKKFEEASMIVNTSLFIITCGIIICSSFIIITSEWTFSRYDNSLVIITIILIASSSISTQFRYIIIASLETRNLVFISLVSSGTKFLLTVILVLADTNELGVLIGFTIAPLLSSALFAFNVF